MAAPPASTLQAPPSLATPPGPPADPWDREETATDDGRAGGDTSASPPVAVPQGPGPDDGTPDQAAVPVKVLDTTTAEHSPKCRGKRCSGHRLADRIRPLSRKVGAGVMSMNVYADVGYTVGPKRRHEYYDYITKSQVEDFGRRDFTSYPLYANQFALAYAYVQGQYEIPGKFCMRVALHAGHIVESLYAEERRSLQMIREAAIYYFFIPKLAVEAGIFPSYYGAQIVLNKKNLHATRAYIADFTPDYEAGARLHYHVTKYQTLRFMVLNGWQEIRDFNGRKAYGFVWSVNKPGVVVGDWNMYWGNESPQDQREASFRHYQNMYYRVWLGERKKWIIFPMFDFVLQRDIVRDAYNYVVSPAFSLRYAIHPKVGVAARYDYLYNKADIVPELATGTRNGWQSHSGTATLEYLPLPQITFRIEGRYGVNKDAVFRDPRNTLVREDWYLLFGAAAHF